MSVEVGLLYQRNVGQVVVQVKNCGFVYALGRDRLTLNMQD